MQISKHESLRFKIPITLKFGKEALNLNLGTLPIGFQVKIAKRLKEPFPPVKGFMRDNGRLVKDPVTGEYLKEYDYTDPEYQTKKLEYEQRLNIAMVHEILLTCDEISFNTVDKNTAEEFYDSIQKELNDFGFTGQHLVQILNTASHAESIFESRVQEEKKS